MIQKSTLMYYLNPYQKSLSFTYYILFKLSHCIYHCGLSDDDVQVICQT